MHNEYLQPFRRTAEWYPAYLSGAWTGEDFTLYRSLAKDYPPDSAGNYPAAFYGSYGSLLGGADFRYALGRDSVGVIYVEYQEDSVGGIAGEDTLR